MRLDSAIIPSQMNPELSPELAKEASFFLRWGYLIVQSALTDLQIEILRKSIDETYASNKKEFIHQLLEKDDRFAFFLDNPPVLCRMKAILGNANQLHSATA